ncbi:hypothetical protein M9Y10_013566 [Tritrichomonas musculus]|uniref:Surface antigen BspA-like protein n=1 Tax=Tritrichomonas musculus TaxID=1915356 RepID=A0ABR2KZ23_9EUKA
MDSKHIEKSKLKSRLFQIPIEKFEEDMNTESSKDKKIEIVDLFLNCNNLRSEEEFFDLESSIHEACRVGDLELLKIYLSETVENQSKDLLFKIDRPTRTASLFKIKNYNSDEFLIPRTFQYESVDYLITSVNDLSQFEVKTIKFETNSNVQTIYRYGSDFLNLFSVSAIEEIYFPPSLKELKKGWCDGAGTLNKIIISPLNDRFIFKENKYLLGKSDPNNDEFDILYFASRDIKEISIPSNIKIISSYAFSGCKNLTKVEISPNSNLEIIESYAFSYTNINEIFIPPKVSTICEYVFYSCENLNKVEIPPNSNLKTIEKGAFFSSNIKEIYFSPNLKELKKGWCDGAGTLNKVIISPLNDRFIFKENKYLLGKSDPNNDEFDILYFASLSTICKYAFFNCHILITIEILSNSNLKTIEKGAFFSSNIKEIYFPPNLKELKKGWCDGAGTLNKVIISPLNDRFIFKENKYLLGKSDPNNDEFDILYFASRDIKEISIPSNIKIISSYAFSGCKNLTKVEISPNSDLEIIESYAFSYTNITEIFIPPKVLIICEYVFYSCENLNKVEIPPNSNLQTIELNAFSFAPIKEIFIPSKVSKISESSFYFCKNLQIVEISEESELDSFLLSAFSHCPEVIIMIPSSFKIDNN